MQARLGQKHHALPAWRRRIHAAQSHCRLTTPSGTASLDALLAHAGTDLRQQAVGHVSHPDSGDRAMHL